MWKCAYCNHAQEDRPDLICPNCGLVLGGIGTADKYRILHDYCVPLSLIMRNQGYRHFFIDACAGSGVVQDHLSQGLTDGSPLIMAKTREEVENQIKDKTKKMEVECFFIECQRKTHNILRNSLNPYREFSHPFLGDANILLPKVLNKCSKSFVFVYIDPFGLGDPPIKYQTVKQVLERRFTELFIHFSWEGVSRMAGLLKHIDHPNPQRRKIARSNVNSLNQFMTEEWQEIERKGLNPRKRRLEYLKLYENILKEYYEGVQYIEIPVGAKNPSYDLFFTTRNETGNKIMKHILDRERRKGSQSLDKYL